MRRDLIGLGLAALAGLLAGPAAARPSAPIQGAGYGPPQRSAYGPPQRSAYGPPQRSAYGPPRGGAYGPAASPRAPRHDGRAGHRRGRFAADPYGFAGGVVAGGEAVPPIVTEGPLLTLPRPAELVPTAWGYGTYGVPTVAGIPSPPRAEPVVYVIDGVGAARPRAGEPGAAGPAVYRRARDGSWLAAGTVERPAARRVGGARVVEIAVPRR
ncbi:hypothetical protein [Methylobacterium sp. WSM2598]|uniref:hypothetical protein n=1 Tax=Methylobacterium sp. WSM2598 TaxID=398261 RepID=UPI0003A510AA|nr:hypothetical protein [Methylobacterium sp. WSM2598]